MESAGQPAPAPEAKPAQPESRRRSIAIAVALVAVSWLFVFFDPLVVPFAYFWQKKDIYLKDEYFRLPYLLAPVLAALYLRKTIKARTATLVLIVTGSALLAVGTAQMRMCERPPILDGGQDYCSTFEYDHGFVWHWHWPDVDVGKWCDKYGSDDPCVFQ